MKSIIITLFFANSFTSALKAGLEFKKDKVYKWAMEDEPMDCHFGDCCDNKKCEGEGVKCALQILEVMGEKEVSQICVK